MSDTIELKGSAAIAGGVRVGAFLDLMKPRVSSLVLVATGVGFCAGWTGAWSLSFLALVFNTILGTALVAAASNALNQLLEVEHDRKMVRTQGRPLVTGRLGTLEVVTFGVTGAVVGVAYLALTVNATAAGLAAVTFLSYVFVYTPLKRTTSMCVLVGAIPGALPPLIGWAGANGGVSLGGWLLFAIVYFWQLPHFAAIAWQYRDDYARAGYPMLSVIDPGGTRTDLHVITHTLTLIVASLLPTLYGVSGVVYGVGAALLGVAFLASGILFIANKTPESARGHVLASIVYLPVLLTLLLVDKL